MNLRKLFPQHSCSKIRARTTTTLLFLAFPTSKLCMTCMKIVTAGTDDVVSTFANLHCRSNQSKHQHNMCCFLILHTDTCWFQERHNRLTLNNQKKVKKFWENVTFYDYELLYEYIIDAFYCHHFVLWCSCVVIWCWRKSFSSMPVWNRFVRFQSCLLYYVGYIIFSKT